MKAVQMAPPMVVNHRTMTTPAPLQKMLDSLHACDASPAQHAYMLAKAAYETAKQAERDGIAAIAIPEPSIDSPDYTNPEHPYLIAAQAVLDRTRAWTFQQLLWQAEKVLVEWAAEHAKAVYGPRYASIAPAFEKFLAGEIYKPELRQQLIDLCLKMPSGRSKR